MQTKSIMLIAGMALSTTAFSAAAETTPAYQSELRADAGSRTSLLQSGATAGHNSNGFFIGSGDGNYNLYVGGYTQFTYSLNFRDGGDDGPLGSDSEDLTNGFDAKRTRLIFQGNVLNPNLSFYIQGAFEGDNSSDSSGGFELLDAYGNYDFDNGWGVKWGQFKAPYNREELVDPRHTLASDTSVVNAVFNAGRTQGVALHYRGDNLGFVGSLNDGASTSNTPYWTGASDPILSSAFGGPIELEADFSVTGRVEYMFAGQWERFEDFTSFRNSDDIAVLLGGAAHYQHGGDTAGFTPAGVGGGTELAFTEYDLFLYTIDISVEGNGWNLFGAFIGRTVDPDGVDSANDFGFVVQGGFFLADQFELFARWDAVYADDDAYGSSDDFNTFTFGGNYYFVPESHAAKLTVEASYFIDTVSDNPLVLPTAPSSTTGLVPDTDDGQWVLRGQMQLVF